MGHPLILPAPQAGESRPFKEVDLSNFALILFTYLSPHLHWKQGFCPVHCILQPLKYSGIQQALKVYPGWLVWGSLQIIRDVQYHITNCRDMKSVTCLPLKWTESSCFHQLHTYALSTYYLAGTELGLGTEVSNTSQVQVSVFMEFVL